MTNRANAMDGYRSAPKWFALSPERYDIRDFAKHPLLHNENYLLLPFAGKLRSIITASSCVPDSRASPAFLMRHQYRYPLLPI